MKDYEVTIVIRPELEDDARAQIIQRVQNLLTAGQGETNAPVVHQWGQRRLAYPIKKFNEGYYVLFEAKIDPLQVNDIERNIRYMEPVLRHLVVRKGGVK
ncbi:MAG: 30S ribosomal protein S6 [Chloroflexota bacterium]